MPKLTKKVLPFIGTKEMFRNRKLWPEVYTRFYDKTKHKGCASCGNPWSFYGSFFCSYGGKDVSKYLNPHLKAVSPPYCKKWRKKYYGSLCRQPDESWMEARKKLPYVC